MQTKTIHDEIQGIVGEGNLRVAGAEDAVCGVAPQFIAEPENEAQLAAVLACADSAGLAVAPRGGGTKMGWGNPPRRIDFILSTARLNRVVEHAWADLTVTVEAGCSLQALQETLARHGQRLAFNGLWPERATVGGALSTNDSGVLRLRFGSLRDLIIGITLALPDGTLASSGGKVVKNVAGYDLPKLATGALGTLGVITRAVFRLHPLPWGAKTLSFAANTLENIQRHLLAIQNSKLAHTALQVRCVAGGAPQADILFEGTDEGLRAQEEELRKLLGSVPVTRNPEFVWNARQELANTSGEDSVIAKISVLPSDLARVIASVFSAGVLPATDWQGVFQATGIGVVRMQAGGKSLATSVERLRAEAESAGGSLVVLRRPKDLLTLDCWGAGGDAVPLMRAVKQRLDPKNTLNPGRFVGGI